MDPVISIIWCILGLFVGLQYAHCTAELSGWKRFLCATVFLIGGPFFIVTQICEAVLDALLPEGWSDDDRIG